MVVKAAVNNINDVKDDDRIVEIVTKTLDDNKAEDVVVMDLKGKTSIASYMVIASGT